MRFPGSKIIVGILLSVLMISCNNEKNKARDTLDIPVIEEVFQTDRDQRENIDSPALWHGPDGEHWLLATAKEGDAILVFDAIDGSFIQRVGESGTSLGQFERPNGIWVIDNLMLVVERDNQRIQVLRLPSFEILGTLTHEDLRYPYGLSVDRIEDQQYELFVTDNYNPSLEGYPPQGELDERVHQFQFQVTADTLASKHIRAFGDIQGKGVLHKVESIYADHTHNRLLIADEAFNQRNVKVYDLKGDFTGDVIPNIHFKREPEGIALYSCTGGSGYWIITDQHESSDNKFVLFDRQTLEYIGTFKGQTTRNTDGVWLSQQSYGPFTNGAFYPVHDDGSVTAVDWRSVAEKLSLPLTCITD